MSEFYDAEPNYICHNRSVQHQDIRKLCKKPKKRITPTLHRCIFPNCNVNISGRNWRNRKPENQVELCDHHVRQRISVIREGLKRL